MEKAVFGIVTNEAQAKRIIERLTVSGFASEDISYLSVDRKNLTTTNTRGETILSKSAEQGPLSLLSGVGAISIPGFGAVVAAGPFLADLKSSSIAGALGIVVGVLVGYGIPLAEAKKFQSGLQAGNILISVATENVEEMNSATEVLREEGAKDLSYQREKTRSSS